MSENKTNELLPVLALDAERVAHDATSARVAELEAQVAVLPGWVTMQQEQFDAWEAAHARTKAELAAALVERDRACAVIVDMWDEWGDHEDGCPEDDTCECPLVGRINSVLRGYSIAKEGE